MNSIAKRKELPCPSDLAACRICNEKSYLDFAEKRGMKYVVCSGCGILRQHPYPSDSEIKKFYSDYLAIKGSENPDYLSDGYSAQFSGEKDLTFSDLRLDLWQYKGKRLLDVGCATGQFLSYVRKFQIDAEGIDVSEELVRQCTARGLKASTKDSSDLQKSSERFDVISAFHVIEHVLDPCAMLCRFRELLRSGGALILETPRVGEISEAFGGNWRYLMPTEHLHLFSKEILFKLLGDAGFSVVSWISFGSGNDSGSLPTVNKRAMDRIAKQMGIGDTLALYARKK